MGALIMPLDRDNLRDLLTALALIGAAMLAYSMLFAMPAWAQLAVSDAPVEGSTAAMQSSESDIDTVQLPGILKQNTATAQSVTIGGGAGAWQSNAAYLNSLASNLNNGITAGLFSSTFPGWQALGPDSTQKAKQVAGISLSTYAGALAAAQQQANGFGAEDSHLSGIEQTNQSVAGVLQAVQLNTEAQLALAQQIQLERQLLVTLITVESVKAGEELNERSREAATIATSANLGVQP
jgi:hypothetical protein